jgi:hypothetical protein
VYKTEDESDAAVPEAFARASEQRNLVARRAARKEEQERTRKKATIGTKIGNWFGIGDPYGRQGPPKLSASKASANFLAVAEAAEKEDAEVEAAAARAEQLQRKEMYQTRAAALGVELSAINETSFDGKPPPAPPPRRIRPPQKRGKQVSNTLKAAKLRTFTAIGITKPPMSLVGLEGTLIKDQTRALAAHAAYVESEKTFKRTDGYATMKMREKYTLRNHAADRALGVPYGSDAAVPKAYMIDEDKPALPWEVARGATMATTKFEDGKVLEADEEERLKEELASLPTFKPNFIRIMTGIHVIMCIFLLFYVAAVEEGKSFGKIGIKQEPILCGNGDAFDCPFGFNSRINENATRIEQVNPWIGPTRDFLIKFNVKLTTCMRTDTAIHSKLARQREETECGTVYPCDPLQIDGGFSCCRQKGSETLGMMSKADCESDAVNGYWETANALTAGQRPVNVKCSAIEGRITLRPCCQGFKSECSILTASECEFVDGVFHEDKELCSEVACLADTCGGWSKLTPNPLALNEVEAPDQWWRLIWPLFTHSGLIHSLFVIIPQWYIGSQIEISVGFLRIFLIYFISGVSGYLLSGLFDPYVGVAHFLEAVLTRGMLDEQACCDTQHSRITCLRPLG